MLEPDGIQKMDDAKVAPFIDTALKSRRAKTAMAGRLWASGLLVPVKAVRGRIHPFTVVKKILRHPVRGGKDLQTRMVLDQRRDNLQWKPPPWTPMASPAAFPFVQAPIDEHGRVECMIGDLPDMYWTLGLPNEIAKYFVLEDV
eukprot:11424815-Heterocapsa_arctica.AAC.1